MNSFDHPPQSISEFIAGHANPTDAEILAFVASYEHDSHQLDCLDRTCERMFQNSPPPRPDSPQRRSWFIGSKIHNVVMQRLCQHTH